MVGKTIGPFELADKLGAGGMGVVYRATYQENGKQVALKLLPAQMSEDDQLVARFKRELEILKKLRHPHIVLCFGGGRLGNQRFYAMELVEGGTLSETLKAKGRLSWEDVVDYGIQICDALQHAHEHGIVHRDLKPANLMLTKKGDVKLTDFGLARLNDATALTAAGKTLGTFAYMAPEQITGKSPITPRTDLYALGCVFYEFLTGKPPFVSESAAELFYQHLKKKPERICTQALDCPVWLEGIVMQLLQKNPEDRPRDALAVAQSLQELKKRVAENAGVLQHSIAGEPSTLNSMADVTQVGDMLKRTKRKKKRDRHQSFYEKTWFQVSALTLILALVVWSLLPSSEETLFRRASELMARVDDAYWREAQEKYLVPLKKRFPNGKYAEKVQEFNDKVEIVRADSRITFAKKAGGDLKNEAARIFMEGSRFEDFGDRVSALEKYKSMVDIFNEKEEDRPYVLLARRQIAAIENNADKAQDRVQIIRDVLDKADTQHADGNTIAARRTWENIMTLYADKREFDSLTRRARRRLSGKFDDEKSSDESTNEPKKNSPETSTTENLPSADSADVPSSEIPPSEAKQE